MKFTTQSAAGAARAKSYKGADASVAEPAYPAGQRVDPSVCIEPLGEMECGAVDIDSPAYTGKFKG